MRILYIILLTVVFNDLYSQTKGIVFDLETKKPVPFANIWIENENIGTTADHNGSFSINSDLNDKFIIVSSVGYERFRIHIQDTIYPIYLIPKIYTLEEVKISPGREKVITIGEYKKSHLEKYVSSTTPQIFSIFFPYSPQYKDEDLYIKNIKFETFSKIASTINLRLNKVNPSGEPGEEILERNLIISIPRGRHTINVSSLDSLRIPFPDDGLFVSIEFLIIKGNVYSFTYLDSARKKSTVFGYMPMIGVVRSQNQDNSWAYRAGKWEKDLGKSEDEMSNPESNYKLAVEIKLTE